MLIRMVLLAVGVAVKVLELLDTVALPVSTVYAGLAYRHPLVGVTVVLVPLVVDSVPPPEVILQPMVYEDAVVTTIDVILTWALAESVTEVEDPVHVPTFPL